MRGGVFLVPIFLVILLLVPVASRAQIIIPGGGPPTISDAPYILTYVCSEYDSDAAYENPIVSGETRLKKITDSTGSVFSARVNLDFTQRYSGILELDLVSSSLPTTQLEVKHTLVELVDNNASLIVSMNYNDADPGALILVLGKTIGLSTNGSSPTQEPRGLGCTATITYSGLSSPKNGGGSGRTPKMLE